MLDPKLAVFTVVGTQEPHLVRLFPRLSCSWLATEMCYHIMAAKMAVGMMLIWEWSTLRNCIATNGNEPTRLPAQSSRDSEMSISEFRGFLD